MLLLSLPCSVPGTLLSLYVKEISIIYEPLESLRDKDSTAKLKTSVINCRFKNFIKLRKVTGNWDCSKQRIIVCAKIKSILRVGA